MKLEHAPEALAHPPSHPHAQCQFRALPPYLHPHALWTSLLMPWDFVCIHSSIYTWARHTFIYFLFMYVCVGLHVCALKLHGEDAFHFCPQMCCKGMLIIPRFTCMLVHPLQPYLLVSCSCKSLDTRVSSFHVVTKGTPPLHVCLLCLFSCTVPQKYAV